MREEAKFLRELSECKRIVDITDYYEKGEHSLMVLEYLEVERSSKHSKKTDSSSSILFLDGRLVLQDLLHCLHSHRGEMQELCHSNGEGIHLIPLPSCTSPPLSQGLHYIHDHRIIHLDMKPANVMLRSTSDEFKVSHPEIFFPLIQLTYLDS